MNTQMSPPTSLQMLNWQMVYFSFLLLGANNSQDIENTVEEVFNEYRNRGSSYHNISHLHEGVFEFMSHDAHLEPVTMAKIILAYTYHDLVYVPGAPDNEERSAEAWIADAKLLGINDYRIEEVANAIRRTDHKSQSLKGVEAYVSDLDLLRLAADPDKFDEYSRQVFVEYKVPADKIEEAMIARKNALQKFLDRPSIYFTEIGASLEDKARANLRRIGCVDPRSNQPSIRPH